MSHTLLLVQSSGDVLSRTYSDFERVTDCIDYVVHMYEDYLRQLYPNVQQLSYDVIQLYEFIDNLYDMSCLVLNKTQSVYVPYNKDWIKEKVLRKLQREKDVV